MLEFPRRTQIQAQLLQEELVSRNDPSAIPPPRFVLLRWACMPFAAFIGSSLAGAAADLVFYLIDLLQFWNLEGSCFFQYLYRASAAGVCGVVYVKIVATVAPASKDVAAIVMVTIFCLLCLTNIVLGWTLGSFDTSERIATTIGGIVAASAAIIACSDIRREL